MDWLGLAGFIKPEARKYDGGGIVTKIKKNHMTLRTMTGFEKKHNEIETLLYQY